MFDGFWHEKLQKKSPRFSWRGDFWGNGCAASPTATFVQFGDLEPGLI